MHCNIPKAHEKHLKNTSIALMLMLWFIAATSSFGATDELRQINVHAPYFEAEIVKCHDAFADRPSYGEDRAKQVAAPCPRSTMSPLRLLHTCFQQILYLLSIYFVAKYVHPIHMKFVILIIIACALAVKAQYTINGQSCAAEDVVVVGDGCVSGAPHYDPEGAICSEESWYTAYCSYGVGADACACCGCDSSPQFTINGESCAQEDVVITEVPCIQGSPHYDPEGMACEEDPSYLTYCSYDISDTACACCGCDAPVAQYIINGAPCALADIEYMGEHCTPGAPHYDHEGYPCEEHLPNNGYCSYSISDRACACCGCGSGYGPPPFVSSSADPTKTPSSHPTKAPSAQPTVSSIAPTSQTAVPTINPTDEMTTNPTTDPTAVPSQTPSTHPTQIPTKVTKSPSKSPSETPTNDPSSTPTQAPSKSPSETPTNDPSSTPTQAPSNPTTEPTIDPTPQPTPYSNYECDDIPYILVILFDITTDKAYYDDDLIEILITVMVETIQSFSHEEQWQSDWCIDLMGNNLVRYENRRRLLQDTVRYRARFNINESLKKNIFDDSDFSYGKFKKIFSDNLMTRLSDSALIEDEAQFSISDFQDIAENTAPIETEPFFDFTDPLMITLMALIGISVSIMIGGKIHARSISADDFRLGPVFLFTVYVWDFYTDLLFAISLYTDYVSEGIEYIVLLVASIVFIIGPLAKNFYDLLKFEDVWRKHPILSDLYKTWLLHYGQFVYVLSFLSGSTYAAINLVNSNFLGLKVCSMGLSRVDVLKFNQMRLVNVVLLENLPQLIIQVIFASLSKQLTDISVLAVASSAVSICLAVLKHINNKKSMDDEKAIEVMFSFGLFHKTNDNLKPYIHKTHAVSKAIEHALKLTRRTVECLPIETIIDKSHGSGLEIHCLVRTTKTSSTQLKEALIVSCDMSNSTGYLHLRKQIASQWEMTGSVELITVFKADNFYEAKVQEEAHASLMEMHRETIQLATQTETPAGEGETDYDDNVRDNDKPAAAHNEKSANDDNVKPTAESESDKPAAAYNVKDSAVDIEVVE